MIQSCRWNPWLPEGVVGGVWEDPVAEVLGPQDGERPEQATEECAVESQGGTARDLDGEDSGMSLTDDSLDDGVPAGAVCPDELEETKRPSTPRGNCRSQELS